MDVVDTHLPTAAALREAFESPSACTIGLEEEVVLLDAVTLGPLPRADEVLTRCDGDPAMSAELPASQLELITPPSCTAHHAAAALAEARRRLSRAADGIGVLAAAAVHPAAAAAGVLNGAPRYRAIAAEYGWVARRQMVAGLHVHVAIRPLDVAVAVYDGVRDHLPHLAALAAAAPFHERRDTGLASVRPKLAENLPRQGIPPAIRDAEQLLDAWRWAARAGALPDVRGWWWELRLHPTFGTIEVRVCDVQATTGETAAIAGVVHALCGHLAARAAAGDLRMRCTPTWKLDANRWSACRHGVHGTLADLQTGDPAPTRRLLHQLLEDVLPAAQALGCEPQIAHAHDIIEHPAPDRHRALVARGGVGALCADLADRFLA